ncbi:MAG: cupin domain-containing protein [Bacteroidota bacterium]
MKRTIVNPIVKDTVTFLQTAEESGGKITDLELTLLPGGRNVLHYHNYSEKFTAIDGELGLKLGKKEILILKPGESYTVPAMVLHNFFNPMEREIRFGIQILPGHQGFENMLRILYGLASDGLTDKKSQPKSLVHTAIIICMAEINAPGLLTIMLPVFKMIARRAKKNGEEQKLIDRYCI